MENIYKIAMPLVKKWEGYSSSVYSCPGGYPTIGFGLRVDIRPDMKFGGILGLQLTEKHDQVLAKHGGNLSRANKELAKLYPNLVTEEESEQWLYESLKNDYWYNFGKDLPHGLTDNQCAALLSFVYNVGVANFNRSTMFKLLQQGKIEKAGKEFKRWVYAGGKRLRGLVNRRVEEMELFFKP